MMVHIKNYRDKYEFRGTIHIFASLIPKNDV